MYLTLSSFRHLVAANDRENDGRRHKIGRWLEKRRGKKRKLYQPINIAASFRSFITVLSALVNLRFLASYVSRRPITDVQMESKSKKQRRQPVPPPPRCPTPLFYDSSRRRGSRREMARDHDPSFIVSVTPGRDP